MIWATVSAESIDADVNDIRIRHICFAMHGVSIEETKVSLRIGSLGPLDHHPDLAPLHIHQLKKIMFVHVGLMKEFVLVRGVNAKGPCIHIVGKQILLRFLDAGYNGQRRKIVPFGRMVAKIVRTMAAGLVPHFINAVKKQVFHAGIPLFMAV